MRKKRSQHLLTEIMLTIFRLNARLLEQGDTLVKPIGITAARWQVLGALALSEDSLTCPQIACKMGISRQGAIKQLHLLTKYGLVIQSQNLKHERSPLYSLSEKGKLIYDKAISLHEQWIKELLNGMKPTDLSISLDLLLTLEQKMLPIEGC